MQLIIEVLVYYLLKITHKPNRTLSKKTDFLLMKISRKMHGKIDYFYSRKREIVPLFTIKNGTLIHFGTYLHQ